MLEASQVETYRRDGFVVLPGHLGPALTAELRRETDRILASGHGMRESDAVYDLEPWHAPEAPAIRRITWPHKHFEFFWELAKHPVILDAIAPLIGDAIRLHGSKINTKLGAGGASVEWHQDWAFYPHSNADVLAVGVMIDDIDAENGPMMVMPGSHRGPLHDHHSGEFFAGAIDIAATGLDVAPALPVTGRAGSISIHHAMAVHGSDFNRSGRSRRFLLYEYAAADAWPLRGAPDYADFRARLVRGREPDDYRMEKAPVRMPFPTPPVGGSVYKAQTMLKHHFFGKTQARA
ncbi:MAG: phytanoyl-CoA dioxygenase family protein [Alphaproteobacteria bacterium]|nr:phytanoyl-CoA dioxygenase family protein [Alphaproteobacteria bacterium]